jgi:hypothetical protein
MGISVFPAPAAGSKTMFRTTLTSGTSYTVPAGVTYLNVTLVGGGGGGGGTNSGSAQVGMTGTGGSVVSSTLSATPGASISYAIGAGGIGGQNGGANRGSDGGTTTFTGATSAPGGLGGGTINTTGAFGSAYLSAGNNGISGGGADDPSFRGGTGGIGCVIVEYWA